MVNYKRLLEKKEFVKNNKHKLSDDLLEKYEKSFDIDFTHNSTAIEGNTLTLIETKLLLEDKLTVGGKKLREMYEVVNHDKTWSCVKDWVENKEPLDEEKLKDIHYMLTENILVGGVYRTEEVSIVGASHTPPAPNVAYSELQDFYQKIKEHDFNPLELSAYTHAEFVRIHPFVDGNGRTSRIIMNYQLLENGFLPISIQNETKLEYYKALDQYGNKRDLQPFLKLVYELEEKELDYYISSIEKVLEKDINGDIEI